MNQLVQVILLEMDKRILTERITLDSVVTALRLIFKDKLIAGILKHGHEFLEEKDSLLVFNNDNYSPSCRSYMTGVLEYIYSDLMQISEVVAFAEEAREITHYHFIKAIYDDIEWSDIIRTLRITFLLPYVHPSLYNHKKVNVLAVQTKHKLVVPYDPFVQMVKHLLNDEDITTKVSKDTMKLLHAYTEKEIIDFLSSIRKQHLTSKVTAKHML